MLNMNILLVNQDFTSSPLGKAFSKKEKGLKVQLESKRKRTEHAAGKNRLYKL